MKTIVTTELIKKIADKNNIENLNGFHTSFSMISQKDIEDIINLPWSGKNYSNRLWTNRTKLKDKVQEQIVH